MRAAAGLLAIALMTGGAAAQGVPLGPVGPTMAPSNVEVPQAAPAGPTMRREGAASTPERSPREPVSVDPSGKVPGIFSRDAVLTREMKPVEIFETSGAAVYVVRVARPNGEQVQGSAVAVSPQFLLTNCHVVDGAASITLVRAGKRQAATLVSRHKASDRCVLRGAVALDRTVRIRAYADLKVGEHVFTIGAPKGLELTMGDGLISARRSREGLRLVQTSAPISPGSSGGGLFDNRGNLIGITTFLLRDSQNLNFAIAAEEYAN